MSGLDPIMRTHVGRRIRHVPVRPQHPHAGPSSQVPLWLKCGVGIAVGTSAVHTHLAHDVPPLPKLTAKAAQAQA
jgi:hypothetical protein